MKTFPPLDLAFLRSEIVGIDTRLTTPYGSRLLTYADYTASGRSLRFVEEYLLGKQELYANSHTEDDTTGRVTTELLHLAEERIKTAVNAGPGGRIIATGNPITIFECGDHLFEKQGYNFCCFNFGKTVCGAEGLDEIDFVHGDPFFGESLWSDGKYLKIFTTV